MTDRTRWKVGELAHASGLSVRVLRHWDEIGLVSPQRTPSGHRCYSQDDVTRLYQVLALRQMGLGLGEITALLVAEDPEPAATLRRHRSRRPEDPAAHRPLERAGRAVHR